MNNDINANYIVSGYLYSFCIYSLQNPGKHSDSVNPIGKKFLSKELVKNLILVKGLTHTVIPLVLGQTYLRKQCRPRWKLQMT